jgi:hypothetical protein
LCNVLERLNDKMNLKFGVVVIKKTSSFVFGNLKMT